MSEYFYVRSNPDWKNKYKYGYTTNLTERLKSSVTEHSSYCKYVMVYEIKKVNYTYYHEFDKIISIDSRNSRSTYKKINDFNKYLIDERKKSEFIKSEGLEELEKILVEIFPLFGLHITKIDEQFLRQIEKNIYEEQKRKEEENEELFRNMMKIKKPYVYQQEVLSKMKTHFNENNLGQIIWACGLGKTLLSLFYIQMKNFKKICIGCSSKFLQDQFEEEIKNIFPSCNIIKINGNADIIFDTDNINFVITTYHSSKYVSQKNIIFDFKIGDECHHIASQENGDFVFFHQVKSEKSLFMTATRKFGERINYSMDNESTFGKIIDEKKIKWAIDNKYITSYNLLLLKNNEHEVNLIIETLGSDKNIELAISAYLTLKCLESGEYPLLTHMLVYVNRKENADIMEEIIFKLLKSDLFNWSENIKNVFCKSLHSGKEDISIKNNIDDFIVSNLGIIICVYILGEGANIPVISGIVIAENMIGNIRIIQSLLRANRKNKNIPNKEAFYILPYSEENDCSYNKIKTVILKFYKEDEDIFGKISLASFSAGSKSTVKERKDILIQNFETLKKLQLRLFKQGIINSSLNYEENEYKILKKVNGIMNIKTIEEYFGSKENRSFYKSNPKDYFSKYALWKNYYHFFNFDTSIFLQQKENWIQYCNKLNIISKEHYWEIAKINNFLPLMPEEFYNDFKGIETELNLEDESYLFD